MATVKDRFTYRNDEMYCEDVPLREIVDAVGTPAYVYSLAQLRDAFRSFDQAFAASRHLVCFSVKANSNLAVLRAFVNEGSGFDIVSGGELFRVLKVGADPGKVVFSGVGKTREEMEYALRSGILMFNVESEQEMEALNEVAGSMGVTAPVSFRINPDVDPQTHPYISTGMKKSKFGIAIDPAAEAYRRAIALPNLEVVGVDCHIGSQLTSTSPFADAAERVRAFIEVLQGEGADLRYVDLGGGLGIRYDDEEPPDPADYAKALMEGVRGLDVTLVLEPGRSMVGNAGILLTRVLYLKRTEAKNFVVVDGAMNDLVRPSLYGAFQGLRPVDRREAEPMTADVVGPICESGDFLAQDRDIQPPEPGDLMAVMSAGAYGFTMASNYNTRPRAAEVLVDGKEFAVVRERETLEGLVAGEKIPAML
ncbi:MAG: diaminopimelate decarboxylase [Deltaproteobacteria bacterium]|nr:diaminopimelate decarboxylase [Deltaproteobacteria bacterium]